VKLFPLNLVLKCEAILNSHKKCKSGTHQAGLLCLDHAEPNHGLHHQIIQLNLLSSGVLHGAESKFLTDVLGQLLGLIFKHQKIKKREHSTTDANCLNLFWGGTYYIV
jgi:hypothetical protein